MVEDKAPEGYIKLDKPIKIVLSSNPSYEQDGNALSSSRQGIIEIKDGNNKVIGYQFTVINNAGHGLPHTGGPGTAMIYLLGIMLASVAGAGLVMRKRKVAA